MQPNRLSPGPGFTMEPLSVGAEIVGLDLTRPLSGATRAALYDAWMQYGILLFRQKDVTTEQHMALSRCFGELEMHPLPELRAKDEPYLIELGGSKRPEVFVYDDTDLIIGRLPWHRDTAYTPECCTGAILRMVQVPKQGGETMFADTALAYDALPAGLHERLESLEYKATLRLGPIEQTRPGAFWKSVRRATIEEYPGQKGPVVGMDAKNRHPPVVLPAVITHPESGRKCLFLSPTYVDGFLGMPPAQSDELLETLTRHMTSAPFCYTHRWEVGDMILWDNRRFMHAARGYPPQFHRTAYRTTLKGSLRVGRYFDAAPDLAGLRPVDD